MILDDKKIFIYFLKCKLILSEKIKMTMVSLTQNYRIRKKKTK